jgi:hypothetical protein
MAFTRSVKSWSLIAGALVLVVCLTLGVLTLVVGPTELARVPLTGSNLTLVLYEDEKGLHRYDVLAGKKRVARDVMLGSRGDLAVDPQISVLGDKVIVTFRTERNTAPYVEFDLATCRIAQHSNQAASPPPISGCQRR